MWGSNYKKSIISGAEECHGMKVLLVVVLVVVASGKKKKVDGQKKKIRAGAKEQSLSGTMASVSLGDSACLLCACIL